MSHKPDRWRACAGCRELEARVATLERALSARATPAQPRPTDEPHSPLARTVGDMVTPRQLGRLRELARAAGVEADAECRKLFLCDTMALSRAAADQLSQHLYRLGKSQPQSGAR